MPLARCGLSYRRTVPRGRRAALFRVGRDGRALCGMSEGAHPVGMALSPEAAITSDQCHEAAVCVRAGAASTF
jgi:hypothetical protein